MEDRPKKWHEALHKVLWSYQNTMCISTSLTPYRLTYGQDAVLLLEIKVKLLMIARKNDLKLNDYHQALFYGDGVS